MEVEVEVEEEEEDELTEEESSDESDVAAVAPVFVVCSFCFRSGTKELPSGTEPSCLRLTPTPEIDDDDDDDEEEEEAEAAAVEEEESGSRAEGFVSGPTVV